MRHDDFIGQVQHRAQLPSRGDAARATRATLETLSERVPAGVAAKLAAQLPVEIGEHLRRTLPLNLGNATGERFDVREFVSRIAARSTTDEPFAAHAARVVCEVTDEATDGMIRSSVADALPQDIRQLVTADSAGPL